jgi:hypothetical protein
MQAVTTGAYRAVEYIKRNIKLDSVEKASIEDLDDGGAHLHPVRAGGHVQHLHRDLLPHARLRVLRPDLLRRVPGLDRRVRLFQAIYMANAGGAWDNAKKVVEVELNEKGTAAARRDGHRRHGRRSVQGHALGRAQPDHQVHDPVRPARGRDGRREPEHRADRVPRLPASRCSSSTAAF